MERKEKQGVSLLNVNDKRNGVATEKEAFNIKSIINELKKREGLSKQVLLDIIKQASSIFINEPTLLKVVSPFVVVGDIHGQFYDLINIFEKYGFPPKTNYLFLGDYVDRGKFCIEVMTLLFCLKINYPKNIYLLRGNHEGRTMTTFFNFKLQCEKKYSSDVYEHFLDLFMKLPLCAHIDKKYFAVHGGLSPSIKTLDDIEKLNRFTEISESGALCDLLWSDPIDDTFDTYTPNKMRSCSYYYSPYQSNKFLQSNKISMIIRGHEVQMKGFKYQNSQNGEPLALTVFSAPKYCDTYKNKGAVAIVKRSGIEIRSFHNVQHPFILNNYMNAFDLTLPLLGAGVVKIFSHLFKQSCLKASRKHRSSKEVHEEMEDLKNLELMETFFSNRVCNLNDLMLNSLPLQMEQHHDEEVPEDLLFQFLQLKFSDSLEKLPNIFGPKALEFVRIKIKKQECEVPESSQWSG